MSLRPPGVIENSSHFFAKALDLCGGLAILPAERRKFGTTAWISVSSVIWHVCCHLTVAARTADM